MYGALTVRIHPELRAKVPWINVPLVQAPSHLDKNKNVTLKASEEFIVRNFQIKRRVPIFQAWAHLVGLVPPIANVEKLLRDQNSIELQTIREALACFRGVKRPYGHEADGDSILAYVIKAPHTITYEPDIACVAKWASCPSETVLVAYVRPAGDSANLHLSSNKVDGVILRWEFVPSELGESDLPENHKNRYSERLW
jgi:hypothetical protein